MWPTRANTNKVTPQGVLHNYGSTRVVKVSTAACSKLSSLSAEVQSSKPSPDWGWVGVTITGGQHLSGWGRHLMWVRRGFLNRLKLWWLISVILVNLSELLKVRQENLLPKPYSFHQPLLLPPCFASDHLCAFHHPWHLVWRADYYLWAGSWCLVGDVDQLSYLADCLLHYLTWSPSIHAEATRARLVVGVCLRSEQTGGYINQCHGFALQYAAYKNCTWGMAYFASLIPPHACRLLRRPKISFRPVSPAVKLARKIEYKEHPFTINQSIQLTASSLGDPTKQRALTFKKSF